jgi:cysteinyl-tRNA synthetase
VDKGFAYESDGDVYFEVDRFADYGKLSGRNLDEQRQTLACDIHADGRKRGQWDFALWKAAKPGEPSWESPWGPGRPGWHIECSTMSKRYLGDSFDIHGGGLDLVFPHHENEIAQAEACTGRPFVRYWMHSGMLNVDMEKMSKSLGNITSCRQVLAEHDADTVRMLMLGTHYRSPLNFSDESLADARAQLDRINNCRFNLDDAIERAAGGEGDGGDRELADALGSFLEQFRAQMDDDFNTAAATGVLFEAVREINSHLAVIAAGGSVPDGAALLECRRVIEEMFTALGLFQTAWGTIAAAGQTVQPAGPEPSREQLVDLLLDVRQAARQMKSFELADRIRDELSALGVRVEDVPDGYRWRFER